MNDEQRRIRHAVVRADEVQLMKVEDLSDVSLEDYIVILELMIVEGRPVDEKLAVARAELGRRTAELLP